MENEKENLKVHKKNKLPFAVFITPTNKEEDIASDYKKIFTDIISDRIQEKYK